MVGIEAHVLEVVVLTASADALLGIGGAGVFGRFDAGPSGDVGGAITEEDGHELVHAGVGEKESGRVRQQRGRRDDRVALLGEEIEEALANLRACHEEGAMEWRRNEGVMLQSVAVRDRDDGVGHRAGADGRTAEGDVAGARAAGDGLLHRGFDALRDGLEVEAVAEHLGDGEDLRAGIRDAFARDVGRGAAGGAVVGRRVGRGVSARAERGGGQHAERTADDGHLVGEDVAKHVFGHEDVELVGIARELHRGVVDIHVAQREVGRVGGAIFGDRLAPEHRGLEDVGFVHGAELLLAGAGGGDGDLQDAFDLGFL